MITAEQAALARSLREAGATIREQIIVLSIVDDIGRAVELAAWQTERRGAHGRWTSTGGWAPPGSTGSSSRSERISSVYTPPGGRKTTSRQSYERSTYSSSSFLVPARTPEAQRIAQADQPTDMLTPAHNEVAKMISEVRMTHEKYVSEQVTEEGKKAKTKSLAVIASLVGGAVLGTFEAKLGMPDIATAVTSVAPAVMESLFEWKKKL